MLAELIAELGFVVMLCVGVIFVIIVVGFVIAEFILMIVEILRDIVAKKE